jgi:hypothetical protein
MQIGVQFYSYYIIKTLPNTFTVDFFYPKGPARGLGATEFVAPGYTSGVVPPAASSASRFMRACAKADNFGAACFGCETKGWEAKGA